MPRRKKMNAVPLISLLDLLCEMQRRRLFVIHRFWLPSFGPVKAFIWDDNAQAPEEVVAYAGQEGYLGILSFVKSESGLEEKAEVVLTAKGTALMDEHRPGGLVPNYQI